jgi:hypothetical protein
MQDAFVGGREQASLRDLNHRFLDLAAARTTGWAAGSTGLSLGLAAQVAPLSTVQRSAAAGCPYALFDLRFQDDGYWRMRLHDLRSLRVADDSMADNETVSFVRLALFYAWHVASGADLAAQLFLGMNGQTAGRFRRITVNQIPALVATEAMNLTARWSDCTAYWNSLTAAASRTDPTALRRVQLYGLQLAAAERLTNT